MTDGVITPFILPISDMISNNFSRMVIVIQIFPLTTINTINISENRNTTLSNSSGRTHILLQYCYHRHDIYYKSVHHDFE
jgi:hypothetical protein